MTTASPDKIEAHVWRISLVVVLGAMMSILDTTIVNVALDTLHNDLGTSLTNIQWVATAYLLALGAVIPVSGWAARRYGAKPIYLLSLVLFTAGSALCGLASSATELIVFRILQGIGGGMILPVGQLMMAEAAGPERMGRVMALISVPAMLAPILGPTIGGLIIDDVHLFGIASWHWIFFVNVPVGVVAVLASIRVLPRVAPKPTERLDYLGLLLMICGIPAVVYGLAEIGETSGFTSVKVIAPIVCGAVLVAAFVAHALRFPRPLLNVRLYRKPTFSTASIATFCVSAALFGGMILLPLYWQTVRHESVVVTGLLTAPQGFGAALMMPLAGRLTDRLGGGPLTLVGVVLVAAATIPFALIGPHTSILFLCLMMVLRGFGIGLAFVPAMAAAFAALSRDQLADATPQMNVLQRVGGSIGVALLTVVLQRSLDHAQSLEAIASSYGTAFWWAVALAALAIIPSIVLIRTERAARRTAASEAAAAPAAEASEQPVAEPIGA